MNRVFTWKVLGVAVGLVLSAGVICLVTGNTGMASALFVVAVLEGMVGAGVVGVVRARHKGKHPATV
jgi:hypothetical protein